MKQHNHKGFSRLQIDTKADFFFDSELLLIMWDDKPKNRSQNAAVVSKICFCLLLLEFEKKEENVCL